MINDLRGDEVQLNIRYIALKVMQTSNQRYNAFPNCNFYSQYKNS